MAPAGVLAVEDRARLEERGPAALHRVDHFRRALDVEVGGLLPGERGFGEVLGGRRRAYRDRPLAQLAVGGLDLLAQAGRHRRFLDRRPHLAGGVLQRVVVLHVQPLDQLGDAAIEPRFLQKGAVGGGGDDESGRDGDLGLGQFAQVRTLAADERRRIAPDLVEPDNRGAFEGGVQRHAASRLGVVGRISPLGRGAPRRRRSALTPP